MAEHGNNLILCHISNAVERTSYLRDRDDVYEKEKSQANEHQKFAHRISKVGKYKIVYAKGKDRIDNDHLDILPGQRFGII
jgi:hypothetical protein